MALTSGTGPRRGRVARFVHDYPYVHLTATLLGNATFIAGSLLLLLDMRAPGIWAFVLGSSAMFLGSLGELVRWGGQRKLRS